MPLSIQVMISVSNHVISMEGYREALTRLKPSKVLFFGDVPDGCEGNIERYDAFYKGVHARRAVDSSAIQR